MDISRYLQRIQFAGVLSPTPELLTVLQETHLLHVPFENLDIHSHVAIDLHNTYYKIVEQNRGGICYELNGLFYQLLTSIGFTVKMVSARVYDNKKGYGPEFDHMAIIAKVNDQDYLVDVGFGEFALHPIKILLNTNSNDPRGVFRVEPYDKHYMVVKKQSDAGLFIPQYIFSETERQLSEFYYMCHYHQSSSDSHFTQQRICSLPTLTGRVTLSGSVLKIRDRDMVSERALASDVELTEVLQQYFNIVL